MLRVSYTRHPHGKALSGGGQGTLSQETEAPYLRAPSLGEVAGNAGRPKLGHGEVIKQKASGL